MKILSNLIRKAIKLVVKMLPVEARHMFIRRLIRLPWEEQGKYEIKVATSLDELSQAFELLHDQYVQSGYMKTNTSGKRFTFYHALPTTTVIVAKLGEKVVGTCSLIQSNSYGVPAEKIFDLSSFKTGGKLIAEISSLAVDRKVDRRQGEINIPLTAFSFLYAAEVLTVDTVVVTCNPKWQDFYQAMYGFEALTDLSNKIDYDFVNGAPAVGLYLHTYDLENKLFRNYAGVKDKSKNLYKYYSEKCIVAPAKLHQDYFTYHKPSMKVKALKYFFEQHPEFFGELSDLEKQTLYSYFQDFSDLSPIFEGEKLARRRRVQRFLARCEAIRVGKNGEPYGNPFFLRTASLFGLSCDAHGPCLEGMHVSFSIRVGPFFVSNVTARVVKVTEDVYSYEITESDQHWKNFIEAQYATITETKEESLAKIEALSRFSLSKVG